jgi:hypothetical protein
MFELPALESLADGTQVSFEDIRKIGADLRITAPGCRVQSV